MLQLLFHCRLNFLASFSPFSSPSSLLHIYPLSSSHHQSIWHLPRAPLLLPPHASTLHPTCPFFSNICWSASVTADLSMSHAEFPFSLSQIGPLSLLRTHIRRLVTSKSHPNTARKAQSPSNCGRSLCCQDIHQIKPLIKGQIHYLKGTLDNILTEFTHHRFEAETAIAADTRAPEPRLRLVPHPQIRSGGSDNS